MNFFDKNICMEDVNASRLTYFVAVVETGSFTAAARRLGVTKAVVSHQIARLESELKATLLIRTTRKVRTTPSGEMFYRRCAEILRLTQQAVAELSEGEAVPRGTLTLTATHDYGAQVVAPAIASYVKRFPGMKVDLTADDRQIDIVDTNLDLSVRVGWLEDSSALARRIGSFRQLLVAAPQFVARLPDISKPQQIANCAWIANRALKAPLRWQFVKDGSKVSVTGRAAVSADTTFAVSACAQAGMGLAVLPDFLANPALANGQLVQVLPEWMLRDGGIHAVFPPSRYRPARVRLFVDILAETHKQLVGGG
jgi:DNA-binding transcriptional LysR family regulator